MPPEDYIRLLHKEIRVKAPLLRDQALDTLYFGGGTPSLLPSSLILSVLEELEKAGVSRGPATEITIEINPATVDEAKLEAYLKAGINRFSVGAQTFNDELLKSVKREHLAKDTRKTLDLLRSYDLNYSFDLLFALPGHTLADLERDLAEVLFYKPPHVSPYCLTVPEGHPLSKGRAPEDEQVQMFQLITETLGDAGYSQYEISNFCLSGKESRHNSLYWGDEPFEGLGLSAHSYSRHSTWGTRYWNPNSIKSYESWIKSLPETPWSTPGQLCPEGHLEVLHPAQSLTDFCHTSLRRKVGLHRSALEQKFGAHGWALVEGPLADLTQRGLLDYDARSKTWSLTQEGVLISNQVFAQLTYLQNEWVAAERRS